MALPQEERKPMRVTLDYRKPTPAHCDVAIFVNGALAGTIKLRQDECFAFQGIVSGGCRPTLDTFLSTGSPDWKKMPPV